MWSWSVLENKVEGRWLQVAIAVVLVSIWQFRDGVIFDNKKVEAEKEFRKVQELAYFWISNRNSKFKLELSEWISNPKTNM